jgi:ribosomal protein S17
MSKQYTIEHYEKFNNHKGEILSVHKEQNDCADIQVGDTVLIDVGRYEVMKLEHMKAFNGGKGQNVLLLIKLVTI